MQTIAEIRRANLEILIEEKGSIAELNEAMGWPRPDPRLTRIRNANTRTDRGTTFQMGDAIARALEAATGREVGWMDNVHMTVAVGGGANVEEPQARYAVQPQGGADYRTIAYSLAAALEADSRKVALKQFLLMVDAAYQSGRPPRH
jgi:hypothetical protein